jgi:6-pyruvoyltetrahydropterin/6-carboxytetrahydropterin synthase
MIEAIRYHDLSVGHRVVGHENKCRWLHGHNYRIHFHVSGKLDAVGRVMDFGVIKTRLCQWLEDRWDHKLLLWQKDPFIDALLALEGYVAESIVRVPFNPTAENMAEFLLHEVGPVQLAGTGIVLRRVVVEETRKCSASASL